MDQLVDLDGFPYWISDCGCAVRLTRCCGAAATFFDADLVCKSCYRDVDIEFSDSPKL